MTDSKPPNGALAGALIMAGPSNLDGFAALIPVPLTSFIGRDREIATVTGLLSRPELRLLTLTGPGGVGKTRLALRVAARAFAGGVTFVPLAAIRNPNLVLTAIGHVLQVPDVTGQSLLKAVSANLADKPWLLILDNFEHLLDAGSVVVELLTACPQLKVICTSRVRLTVSGEHVFTVPPLPVSDVDDVAPVIDAQEEAVQLFVQRAEASSSHFVLTPQNVQHVRTICRRLDGIPLAIELAAARINVLSPQSLLLHLEHRLTVLTNGPRDAPPRHQDMRETITWSYDLLSPSDQALLRRLAVFNGGFSLQAAQAVADDGLRVLDGVSALVSASLIVPTEAVGGESRFAMLETIREFAWEQATASGEAFSIQRAHAHHYTTLAEQMRAAFPGPEFEDWMQQLRPEIGNIRSALAWALVHEPDQSVLLVGALDEYWIRFGHITEGREWVSRALAAGRGAPAVSHAQALLIAGWMASEQDDLTPAEVYLADALAIAGTLADHALLQYCFAILGGVALRRGDHEWSHQLHEQELKHAELSGQPFLMAVAQLNLGRVALATGDLCRAQAFLERSLSLHQTVSGSLGVVIVEYFLGQVMLRRHEYSRAVTCFRHAFEGFTKVGDLASAARSLEGLAASVVISLPAPATTLLGVAAAYRERAGHPHDRTDRLVYDQAVSAARTALGEGAFDVAWDAGRHRSPDEVLAELCTGRTSFKPRTCLGVDVPHPLSPREQEVLHLVVEGYSNRAIAKHLSLSERTVETHVRHILHKLDVETRTAAVTYAVRHGLV